MTESLYRKYRPQTFADVVGQDTIERTLRNALARGKVSHAYLFCGPRGTGKTTTARLMAKAILCEKGTTPDPDGTCESCKMIANGTHPDVYELDAASRTGVENVREEIIGRVNFAPTIGRAKVYIIDEVHMLSTAAFNALLKTLEEPPDHVIFILCTTDPNKVPATIHSRCQRFDFHRISADEIVARLGAICVEEDVEFEPEALDLIAERSDGGMRNALTTLEQLIVFCDGKLTLAGAEDLLGSLDSSDMAEIVDAIGQRDAAACFSWTADYVETGADLAQFARDLAERVRCLYLLSVAGNDVPLEVGDEERSQMEREMAYFDSDRLARLLALVGDLQRELRLSNNPRLSFEIALTRMIRPDADLTLESLAERVDVLEKALAARPAGAVAVAAPVVAVAAASVAPASAAPVAAPVMPAPSTVDIAPASESAAPAAPAAVPATLSALIDRAEPVAPAPAAQAIGGLGNPSALQRNWQAALNALKKMKAAYGVLFMNTKVSASDTGTDIIVSFPATNSFAYSAVQKPEVYEAVDRAIVQVFGQSVPLRFVKEGSTAPAAPQPAVSAVAASASPQVTASAAAPAPAAPAMPTPPAESAPVDDDCVPYDDEAAFAPAEEEATPVNPASAPNTASDDASSAGNEDIEGILTASFGDAIVFEEIDEN